MSFTLFFILAVTLPFWIPGVALLGGLSFLFLACVYAGGVEMARAMWGARR